MDELQIRHGTTLAETAVESATSKPKRKGSVLIQSVPEDHDMATQAANKANAIAAIYRLSKTPRQTTHTKVMRVRRLNALHASGAFDLNKKEEKDEIQDIKKSEEKSKKSITVDDFDDMYFEDDDDYTYNCHVDEEDESQKLYNEACKEYRVQPLKLIYNSLTQDTLALISIVLRLKEAKATATALVKNCSVEALHLENNSLGGEGARYFGDVLTRNMYLTDVKIVENNLRSEGAKSICRALRNNNVVRRLDLSGNGFIEDDAHYFREMLDENHALRELYLGHNEFREKGGEIFADGLASNDFLRVLDLSWNHLRMGGATAIGKALQVNHHLEKLDISWNGFHVRGAITIADALKVNNTLIDLNLNCNRLTDPCVSRLLQGLEHNTTLKVLRMAKNPMYTISAQNILQCIDTHPTLALELVDLGDQCVSETFEDLLEQLKRKREITVIYGMVWRTDRQVLGKDDSDEDEDNLINEDPLLVLFEFARMQNLRLIDMFVRLDKDKSGALSRDEFIQGLEEVNIPMRIKSLNKLIDKMDQDGDGEIDFSELLAAQKKHKEKLKEYMRGDIPLENTEIGRIDNSLRKVMHKRFQLRKF